MPSTRAIMSSAVRRPVSTSRAARVSPTPAIDTAICVPSATMRSTVVDPARSIDSRDVLGGRAQSGREPLAGLVQSLAQTVSGGIEVPGNAAVRVGDRVAHARTAGDDRFALIGHLGDERANPAFVVGVGALERRDFGLHPGFEFSGARQRPLDAVAHRCELAADRLRKGGDMFARDRLRLRKPNRDLRNRARRLAQFSHAARKRGKGENEKDRPQRREKEQGRLGTKESLGNRGGCDRGPQALIGV